MSRINKILEGKLEEARIGTLKKKDIAEVLDELDNYIDSNADLRTMDASKAVEVLRKELT